MATLLANKTYRLRVGKLTVVCECTFIKHISASLPCGLGRLF